jgi:hypothetical protein
LGFIFTRNVISIEGDHNLVIATKKFVTLCLMHAYFVLKLLPHCSPRFVGQSSCWNVYHALPKCLALLSILYDRILRNVLNQLIELLLLLCHKVLSFPCSSGCNNIGFWCCHACKRQNSHTTSLHSQWQLTSLYGSSNKLGILHQIMKANMRCHGALFYL